MEMKRGNKKQAIDLTKPLWHGVILVAGGAVGAGMFALPLMSAGAWFISSTMGLLVVCLMTYIAAKLLIDINVKYPVGSSFDTLIRSVLGDTFARGNNVSIAFIMFILMYAYITAGASILQKSMLSFSLEYVTVPRPVLSILFASLAALFIWLGTSMVSRVSTILMLGMCLAFSTANSGLLLSLDLSDLLNTELGSVNYVWVALPVFVTAFACAGLVPSLSLHYDNQGEKVRLSICLGLSLALIVYVIWLASTLGNISREGFTEIAANGGGLGALVSGLHDRTDSSLISSSLTWFSHFAVITSFLSIGLGLVHFLADKFTFNTNATGRAKSVALAFLPPLLASIFAPFGFVSAIAYAGVFVAFSFFIVPALMYRKLASEEPTMLSRSWIPVLGFGIFIIVLKLLSVINWLPNYP